MNMNIEEEFKKDTKDHVMKIIYDNGDENRSIEFSDKNGSSAYHYLLTTFSGHLVYTGDMGCFVFEGRHDMFRFFGHENYAHYGDMLKSGKWEEFDLESSKAKMIEYIKSFDEDECLEWYKPEIIHEISEINSPDDGSFHHEVVGILGNYGVVRYWISNCITMNPTDKFKWSIMAINKGIAMYKESKI